MFSELSLFLVSDDQVGFERGQRLMAGDQIRSLSFMEKNQSFLDSSLPLSRVTGGE